MTASVHPRQAASSGMSIGGVDAALPVRRRLVSAALFVGLSLTVAAGVALTSRSAGSMALFALALTPAVIALALARAESRSALRGLVHGLTILPADRRWWLVLLIPAIATLAVIPFAFALGDPLTSTDRQLFPAILIVPIVVLIPALAEELGWRGFALPRLMAVMSPLQATLLLAIPWAVMHLVLYLPGLAYEGIAVWPSVVTIFAMSVLGTWVFIGTGGSVLMTGLFHAVFNGSTPLGWLVDADTEWALRPLILAAVAIVVVASGGLRRPVELD